MEDEVIENRLRRMFLLTLLLLASIVMPARPCHRPRRGSYRGVWGRERTSSTGVWDRNIQKDVFNLTGKVIATGNAVPGETIRRVIRGRLTVKTTPRRRALETYEKGSVRIPQCLIRGASVCAARDFRRIPPLPLLRTGTLRARPSTPTVPGAGGGEGTHTSGGCRAPTWPSRVCGVCVSRWCTVCAMLRKLYRTRGHLFL